jgi:UDP-N-acetylglucosamine--N-acetylmuramyl-(pentapeptide) pyrophosphoryl-undecaprenol N-acetylglucosamine transferase
MPAAPHVLFAGGGAVGHLAVGLAVAEHLHRQMPTAEITFAGSGKVRERHAVRSAGFQYVAVPSQPAPQNPLQAVRFVTDSVAGYCASRWMLREQQIALVVGLGGSVSATVVRAAVARGVPVVMLEQNAVPCRTTRWLSHAAAMVCAGFAEVRPHLHVQAPVTVTGNPVRSDFEDLHRRYRKIGDGDGALLAGAPRPRRLVVLGGSSGGRSLNAAAPRALQQVADRLAGWQIVHQTGEGQLQETEDRYRENGTSALAVTYIDQIASVLFASDLVICRAGGVTLAELALAGVPAITIPYPDAVDDHQTANAKVFAAAGACRLIDESSQADALHEALARELDPLLRDAGLRSEMSRNMLRLAYPDAAADVARVISSHFCVGSGRRAA